MKKILFKTIGWIIMVVMVIWLFQTDPVTSPWKFILQIISIFACNDFFDLYIENKLSKIKDWFLK